jgi:hypothetical protein
MEINCSILAPLLYPEASLELFSQPLSIYIVSEITSERFTIEISSWNFKSMLTSFCLFVLFMSHLYIDIIESTVQVYMVDIMA